MILEINAQPFSKKINRNNTCNVIHVNRTCCIPVSLNYSAKRWRRACSLGDRVQDYYAVGQHSILLVQLYIFYLFLFFPMQPTMLRQNIIN